MTYINPHQEKKNQEMGSENESSSSSSSSSSLHIVMFPWFAFGHISPFVQLSNKLSSHGVQISFLSAPGNIQRISSSLLQPAGSNIKIIPLEIPTVEGLPPGLDSTADMSPPLAELLKKAVDLMQPQIKSLLINLRPQIIFFDFAQQWLPPIASELGIKTIFFSVFAAVSSAYLTVPARLLVKSEPSTTLPSIDELKKPPTGFPQTSITTTKTHLARDFQYVFRSFHGGACVYDRVVACMKACDAIVVKSCNEMEAPYIDFMKIQYKKPVLLAGPVVPEPPVDDDLDEKWGRWLSKFPSKSVVFASFGSETFLKDDEIKQLVLGLELSGLPFFVVLNFPVGEEKSKLKSAALPQGFEERVKDKGIIHTGWVQQKQILAHDSVGCFVCHSGFSSVTEGLMNDCQLVLLPLKGDQFLNSKLVSGDMKAGVEVNREDEDGHFGKGDLFDAVKKVMVDVDEEPGKSVRMNQKKWKEFLLDKEVHNKFIIDFVMELKKLVTSSSS